MHSCNNSKLRETKVSLLVMASISLLSWCIIVGIIGTSLAGRGSSAGIEHSTLSHDILLVRTLGIPTHFGDYINKQFEKEEFRRQNESLKLTGAKTLDPLYASSSPFITGNGFRDICLPYVIDRPRACRISENLLASVPDGKMSASSVMVVTPLCIDRGVCVCCRRLCASLC